MTIEVIVKRRIRKLKEAIPEMDEKQLERELIPLSGEELEVVIKNNRLILKPKK